MAMHEQSIVYCLRERVIKVPLFLFVCFLNLSTILRFCMRKILEYIKGNFHDFLEIMVDVLNEFLFRHPLSPKRLYSVNQFLFVLRLHFRFYVKSQFVPQFSMGFKSGLSGGVRNQFISFSSRKALAHLVVCWDHYPAQICGPVASD